MKPKRLLVLGVFLVGVTAAASLTAAQKPAPPQPTEQQKLKERVDALESQLKEAQAKADRAAMDRDYIERIQKETKDFYDKAFNSQMWTLGIMGVILTAVFGLTARFGLGIFDRRIQDSLHDASSQLETKFDQKLTDELQTLKDSNAAQMEKLRENLQRRISDLDNDLDMRSRFQAASAVAFSAAMGGIWASAEDSFRTTLMIYKEQQPRQLISKHTGASVIAQLFLSMRASQPDKFPENAAKELATPLFSGLHEELALAASLSPGLAPFLTKQQQAGAPTPLEKAHSGTAPAPPNNPTTK